MATLKKIDATEKALPTSVIELVGNAELRLRSAHRELDEAQRELHLGSKILSEVRHPESATYARALDKLADDIEVNLGHVKDRHDDLAKRTAQVSDAER